MMRASSLWPPLHRKSGPPPPYASLRERTSRASASQLTADALDIRAAIAEFCFEAFEAAVEVVDAVDGGFALGSEAGDDQRDGSAEVGGHDLGSLELGHTSDGRNLAVDADVGAEARELGDVHV